MKIKGAFCLFFILSVCCSQALALDLSYKSDIPADNKPPEEYLKKRNELGHGNWNTEKLAEDNALAEKREDEVRKYNNTFDQANGLSFTYDWDGKKYDLDGNQLKTPPHMKQTYFTRHVKEQIKRRCYRETRQKLEKEKGNSYSYADIADACVVY
ncbi:hypothetical protein FE394_08840 [Xenorhabdus sp. Reich]|uniref:Uncharacterized protein n=1 Tax=Xenorhabdus littoralis TaxID=2582835 RepID=A0ABU4SL15_9GAMM|nr:MULTISPECIES: hypothetical protein [unclassified Xenorhabdus]MDX7991391.1 hypothetical protein [Xenorhabdus sp. psl]MDX7999305.1 hypothetical protein [Xenorhabdus sp. Reich]